MDDPGTSHVPEALPPTTESTHELRNGMFALLEVASAFQGSGLDLLDLMLIGSPGLIEALDNHDPDRDGDVRTHASPLIERSIRQCLGNARIPRRPTSGRT